MSVLTLASQDFAGSVAGPTAFSARKNAPETAGEKAGDAFDTALAQSENDAPAPAATDAGGVAPLSPSRTAPATDAAPDAVSAPADFARDGGLWRDLSAVSGEVLAAKPSTASAETATLAPAAPDARAKPPAPDAIAKSLGLAGATPTPPAAADNAIASTRGIDRKAPAAALPRASGTIPATPTTPAEKAAPASGKTPAAQQAKSTATSAAPRTPTTAPVATPAVDALAASSLLCVMSSQGAPEKASVSGQTGAEASASVAGATEADSVARIGAALASVSRRATAPGGVETSAAQADVPLAASDAAATSSIHVVARQTWLPPVRPAFSPGLNRQAAADRATLEAPRASRASAAEASAPESSATVAADAPAAVADTESSSSPGFASSAGPVVLANDDSDSATRAVEKKPAAAPETPSAAPLAATPRRDLEITLAPKDLGGLAVRMKSAGDRLEIAFVADKGETARMISDKSATLESQLHGAGLGLGGIDINAAARMEAGAAGTPLASAGAQNAPADPRENAQNAPPRQDFSGRGRQDQSHETDEKTGEPRASNGDRGLYL
jgi:hypothetical protein